MDRQIEMTRGMELATWLTTHKWTPLAALKRHGVEYNDTATLRDIGWLEEKTDGQHFWYRQKAAGRCVLCGEYNFAGYPRTGFPRQCTGQDGEGHLWEFGQLTEQGEWHAS